MSDLISRQAAIMDAESFSCSHEDDLISRQAAIDAPGEQPLAWEQGEYEEGLQTQWESDVEAIKALPPAQPEPFGVIKHAGSEHPLSDEEIIPRLRQIQERVGGSYAIDMVIELLTAQPEPCEDAVSKETILKFIDDWVSALDESCHNQSVSDLKIIKRDFENLPSVTPKQPEQDWIPASEGMPEEREWIGTKRFGTTISDEVYVTFETPKGERFCKHIRFQNGKLNSADQHTIDTIYKGSKPIAWIPLPKPWKGDAE